MAIIQRVYRYGHGLLKRYGPSSLKKVFWDQEFANGHWNFIDNTLGDPVYPHLEKYVGHGSILDLGCGPGNTATELSSPYRNYVGLDISEVALEKARKKTAEVGRSERNRFACGDFMSFDPGQKFEVILFRESMYHVPLGKVKAVLDRYTQFLTEDGVFIVRLYLAGSHGEKRYRPKQVMRVIEDEFEMIEKANYDDVSATSIAVFRPRGRKTKVRLASQESNRKAAASV
jgi:SAM-dependent methyltransferase